MKVSRRFVLKGLGATVAIPVLPSLLTPSEARAQAATPTPCFASFATNHGGLWAENMFPVAPASATTATYAGRTSRRFPLSALRSDGLAVVSPVLTAPDGTLTPTLLGKMFTVQGFGVPFYLAHHTGGALGNYAINAGNGDDAVTAQANARRRTIDQIMGWSTSFYPDALAFRQRVLVAADRTSYQYSNPDHPELGIQEVSRVDTAGALFDALFPQTGTPTGRPIVDRVLESYQRLRSSSRISRGDRDRLDAHVQRLYEVQRRLGTVVSCGAVARPTNPSMELTAWQVPALDPGAHAQYFQAFNDVIVLAFSCGVSRVAVNRIDLLFSAWNAGDWHQGIAHQADVPANQDVLCRSHQRVFADVVLDLAAKLDAVSTGDGGTLLDRSLVTWVQECGNQTHDAATIPVVGFGSAQGFLQTGYHLDYRNLALPFETSGNVRYPGLLWNQWLGTVLQAMRIPRAEWENPPVCGGYPDYGFQNLSWTELGITAGEAWPAAVWDVAGEVPPWLRAT